MNQTANYSTRSKDRPLTCGPNSTWSSHYRAVGPGQIHRCYRSISFLDFIQRQSWNPHRAQKQAMIAVVVGTGFDNRMRKLKKTKRKKYRHAFLLSLSPSFFSFSLSFSLSRSCPALNRRRSWILYSYLVFLLRWMYSYIDGWSNGWKDGRIGGWTHV